MSKYNIPSLDECVTDSGKVKPIKELMEEIYQHKKAVFKLNKIAWGFYNSGEVAENEIDFYKQIQIDEKKPWQFARCGRLMPEKASIFK